MNVAEAGRAARWLVIPILVSLQGCTNLDLGDLARLLPGSGKLDEATVSDGLREALSIGTERTAEELSATGGFGANAARRLPLPKRIEPMLIAARDFGLGAYVDSMEDGLNRAAEAAAGEAVPVFAQAIQAMTIADAFQILEGPDDAATRYFREKTSGPLRAGFTPVVRASMKRVGVYAQYQKLVRRYEMIPYAKPMPQSLEGYVTVKTLAVLFDVLAGEEARIRADPAARTTSLLRRVFSAEAQGTAED